jgi:hypothetical protein
VTTTAALSIFLAPFTVFGLLFAASIAFEWVERSVRNCRFDSLRRVP